jgi:hypothetical protein
MTPTKATSSKQPNALEAILDLVESIDRNVEEILDNLADHLAEMRYTGLHDGNYVEGEEFE